MHRLRLVVPLLMFVVACKSPTGPTFLRTETMYVASFKVECVGVGPQTCLQVRSHSAAAWSRFHGEIEGFTYEPGFEHELRVAVYEVHNPPADGPSLSYQLVREERRFAVPPS